MGCLNASIVLLSLCGVALSYYAVYVARAKHSDQNFQPSCDLDETISCTHALLSEYVYMHACDYRMTYSRIGVRGVACQDWSVFSLQV